MSDNNRRDNSDFKPIDIMHIFDSCWSAIKRLWIIMLATIVICAGLYTIAIKVFYKPYYEASATFVVNSASGYAYDRNSFNKDTAYQMAETFPYILQSGVLYSMIEADVGEPISSDTLSASSLEDTNLLTLKAKASTPRLAYDILQSTLTNYPTISDQVVGETVLELLDETGVPEAPANQFTLFGSVKRGALIGLGIDILLLIFSAASRRTITEEEDIKKILNIKYLGAVPMAKFKKRSRKVSESILIDNQRIPYYFKESFRGIRTKLKRRLNDMNAQVIMVTSALPSEGKSTTAANIALSLAQRGDKVLLVDGDLRNPSVAEVLGMKNYKGVGFAGVLKEPSFLDRAIVRYQETELYVLPGGKAMKKPGRFISYLDQDDILENLKKEYTYIIFDASPSGLLSDATGLAKYVDATLFIVKQDYAKKEKVMEGISMVAEANKKFVGCILTQAKPGLASHSYNYGYGYGYGYGSGYGYGDGD